MDFQKFVTGSHKALGELREAIGNKVMEPEQWLHKFDGFHFQSVLLPHIQPVHFYINIRVFRGVYMDRGHGYSEEDSFFVKDAYAGENRVMLSLLL